MEIASLGFEINSSQAAGAARDLDRLSSSADRATAAEREVAQGAAHAEAGLERAAAEARSTAGAFREMANAAGGASGGGNGGASGAMRRAAAANDNMRNSSKLTTNEIMNLGYQFQDLGVQIASGSNPMVAFIQQASQMSNVFGQAATRGIGFTQVLRQFGARLGAIALAAAPLVAVLGAVAGVAALADREMKKGIDSKKILEDLKLTEKQLDRLKDKKVKIEITMGDSVKGFGKTLGDSIKDGWNDALKSFGTSQSQVNTSVGRVLDSISSVVWHYTKLWSAAFMTVAESAVDNWKEVLGAIKPALDPVTSVISDVFGKASAIVTEYFAKIPERATAVFRTVIGIFGGVARAVPAVMANLPKLIADLFVTAFNGAGRIIANFVNKNRDTINTMLAGLTAVLRIPPLQVPEIKWTDLTNPAQGAADKVADAFQRGFNRTSEIFDESMTAVDKSGKKFLKDWQGNSVDAAQERLKKLAGAAGKDSNGKSILDDGARAIKSLQEQVSETNRLTTAREALNRQVMAGTVTFQQAADQQEINAKLAKHVTDLENIDTLRKAAKGQVLAALTKQYELLKSGIDDYRKALERQQQADAVTEILKRTEALREQNRQLRFEGELIGKNAREAAIAIARQGVLSELKAKDIDYLGNKQISTGNALNPQQQHVAQGMFRDANANANLETDNAIRKWIDAQRQSAAQAKTDIDAYSKSLFMSRAAAAAYRREQEMINDATRIYGQLTPDQIAGIKDVAAAYGEMEKIRMAQEATEDWRRTIKGAFTDFATGAKTFSQALASILLQLAEMRLAKAFDKLWDAGLGAASGGLLNWMGLGSGSNTSALTAKVLADDGGYTSYDGGGYTGNGSRSGGLDGKGGFWAVMHPRETVIDHTKGQAAGGGNADAALAALAARFGQIMEDVAVQAGRGTYERTSRNMNKGRLNTNRAQAMVG